MCEFSTNLYDCDIRLYYTHIQHAALTAFTTLCWFLSLRVFSNFVLPMCVNSAV